MSCVGVPHPQDVVPVRIESGKGHGLEPVHDGRLHLRGDVFPGSEGQHAGGIPVPELQGVDEQAGPFGISAQHHGRGILAPCQPVIGHVPDRSSPASGSVSGESDDHSASSRMARSMAIRRATTWTPSAALRWVFTHLAIMFRFALIRLSMAILFLSSCLFLTLILPR